MTLTLIEVKDGVGFIEFDPSHLVAEPLPIFAVYEYGNFILCTKDGSEVVDHCYLSSILVLRRISL